MFGGPGGFGGHGPGFGGPGGHGPGGPGFGGYGPHGPGPGFGGPGPGPGPGFGGPGPGPGGPHGHLGLGLGRFGLQHGPGWGFGPGSIPVGAFGPGGYAERTGAPGVADDANYNWRRPYGNWWQTLRHYLHELKLTILGPDPPKLHRRQ